MSMKNTARSGAAKLFNSGLPEEEFPPLPNLRTRKSSPFAKDLRDGLRKRLRHIDGETLRAERRPF